VILYRKILQRELAKVRRVRWIRWAVIRDQAENDAIRIPVERNKAHFTDGFASHVRRTQVGAFAFAEELVRVFSAYTKERVAEKLVLA